MKRIQPPRATKRPRRLSHADLDAPSTDRIIQMLQGENDLYWHRRIKHLFAVVGIATRRIERMEEHPVWQAWLTRTRFDLAPDNQTAIQQLRKILRDGGLKIKRDEFSISDRRGDQLHVVFMHDVGAPGVLQPLTLRGKQGELWAKPLRHHPKPPPNQ